MADSGSDKPALHRSVLVVDVAGFSDPARTNSDRLAIRAAMHDAVDQALTASGVHLGHCEIEDRGDGILIFLPPEFPKSPLVTHLPDALAGELTRHNEKTDSRINFQMRLALHAGEVHFDRHGVVNGAVGDAVNLPFRLIEAPDLKAALRPGGGPLAVVVSEWFYDAVVRHTPDARPAAYEQIRVAVKKTRTTGWMRVAGSGTAIAPVRPIAVDGTAPVARQLPRRASDFTGRALELEQLGRWADDAEAGQAVVGVLDGMAGSGKTALVVHWAHEFVGRFPDGQLSIDLHGHAPDEALSPGAALGILLRGLGLPDQQIPYEPGERAAVYRSLVAGRRMLILLDNAAAPAQVRDLLPAAPGPLVLITSRSRLSGLDTQAGMRRLAVPGMPKPEAVELLAGPGVDAADRRSLERLADLCGLLPLAIRIVGERIAGRSGPALGDLVRELEGARLNVLTSAEDPTVGVRAAFSWSYRALPPEDARVFRLLGTHPCPDLPLPAIAALAGLGTAAARRTMRLLTGLNLAYEMPGERYRLHDLMRVYAADLAADGERDQAIDRLLRWYTGTALIADGSISPRGLGSMGLSACERATGPAFASHADAMRWFEAERVNLVELARLAMNTRRDHAAWRLSESPAGYFLLRQPWRDWIGMHEIGRLVAHRAGDPIREAWSLVHLGLALKDVRGLEEALDCAERALEIFRAANREAGEGAACIVLGIVHRDLRSHTKAIDYARRAVEIFERCGESWYLAMALTVLGMPLRESGRRDEALACMYRAVDLFHAVGDQWGEGLGLGNIARVFRDLGRHDKALDVCAQALTMHRSIGDRWAMAMDHYISGSIRLKIGRSAAALADLRDALQIFCDIRDRYGKGVSLAGMGQALQDMGRHDEARSTFKSSIELLEKISSPRAAQVRRLLSGTERGR